MQIRIPIMIQDPKLSGYQGLRRIVERPYMKEDSFQDGPACPRVAVRDIVSGAGMPGSAVPFQAPTGGRKLWRYAIADPKDIYAPDFMAVSVFGTVLHTMRMFEEEDTLGRPVTWGFPSPQLLINPRAGWDANAYYSRTRRSLEFYYFDNPNNSGEKVYTALSRDIVCHEAGHAILDGIAPWLLTAITPQAVAMHEAIADLVAVVMSFRSRPLRVAILEETRGSIEDVGAFAALAEEFGMALDNVGYLRDLRSPLTMATAQHDDFYSLSQVLSGALYAMIIGMHERWWRKFSGGGLDPEYSASGKALAIAADHFKRMIFRALDYLPPGEVSFADYGRAIIAADQASHPEDDLERQFIRDEFVRRGIISDAQALEVETDYEHAALRDVDLKMLVQDDDTAQAFVDRNRAWLHIPKDAAISIEPRLDVTKLYYHRGGRKRRVRECLLKVGWRQKETNPIGSGWPANRWVRVGTTLAIDWKTRRIRALLSTNPALRPEEAREQQEDRNLFLKRLAQSGVLQLGGTKRGLKGVSQTAAVQVSISEDVLEIGPATNMLHFPR